MLSVGGNDVVKHIGILEQPATSSGSVHEYLDAIATTFHEQYDAVVRAVVQHADRVILCTIYDVQLEPPVLAQRVRVPLALLNDRIVRIATKLALDTLDCARSVRSRRISSNRSSLRRKMLPRSPSRSSGPCGGMAASPLAECLLPDTKLTRAHIQEWIRRPQHLGNGLWKVGQHWTSRVGEMRSRFT